MPRKTKPSKTALGDLLRSCQFDPRASGINMLIVDQVLTNPSYGEPRGIELICEAQAVLNIPVQNPEEATKRLETYTRLMKQAIGLLALTVTVRHS